MDKSTAIGDTAKVEIKDMDNDTNWFSKHPILTGVISSIIGGIILLFSFWSKIVNQIEGIFK